MVTPGIVNEYLRILNLQFQYNGAQWVIPFHQDNVEVDLMLMLSENFLRFEVPLMAEETVSQELLNQLFEMNYRIAMAKFAIADDGMIRLVCDFPTVNLSFEEFQVSMQIVVTAAFDFIPQIAALKAKPIGFEVPKNQKNQIM
ncbi:hypothetical protein [Coprothermobacter platensis]|jgi:hypothetical protein|uniref:hypothetical protein n=1 Tax=Coprothermobacter platensis TaxID=108819 RepID=UPI0003703E6D|nr:hypothetical protein [Coprothermobacter platensis]